MRQQTKSILSSKEKWIMVARVFQFLFLSIDDVSHDDDVLIFFTTNLQFQNLLGELSLCADAFLMEASKYGEVRNILFFESYLSFVLDGIFSLPGHGRGAVRWWWLFGFWIFKKNRWKKSSHFWPFLWTL